MCLYLCGLDATFLHHSKLTPTSLFFFRRIGLLTDLMELDLRQNYRLTGIIPSEIANLRHLEAIRFCCSGISGSFPTQLARLTKLTEIMFSNTQLTSTLNTELGNLSSLKTLLLPGNQISGTLPNEINQLTKLIVSKRI